MSQNLISVSSLNIKIKSLLEATFMHIMVEGEVASATYHSSGHLYFSIKDGESSIKCVMWRSSVARMKFRIETGVHIVVDGSVSVYTPRGEYQFQAVRIEPYGQGALALAFEQLKTKLKDKGYFDAQRKKPMPKYPKKIALVTAKDSAALHDMLKIIEKRWALVDVTIVDTLVQGDRAGEQIARSLKHADTLGVDVVIVGRGGGSAEDLWAFNLEVVADAIYEMQTPTVSAVGHEVDTMISDFVADLRAPTPSAAIEMVLPDVNEVQYMLDGMADRMSERVGSVIVNADSSLSSILGSLLRFSPNMKLEQLKRTFAEQAARLTQVIEYKISQNEQRLPSMLADIEGAMRVLLANKHEQVERINRQLEMNNPKHKSKSGWAEIVSNGKRIDLNSIMVGDEFDLVSAEVKVRAKGLEKTDF